MDNFIENNNLQTIILVYKSKKDQNTGEINEKKNSLSDQWQKPPGPDIFKGSFCHSFKSYIIMCYSNFFRA